MSGGSEVLLATAGASSAEAADWSWDVSWAAEASIASAAAWSLLLGAGAPIVCQVDFLERRNSADLVLETDSCQ